MGRALRLGTDEHDSPLLSYEKAARAVLVPGPGQETWPANVDGETFAPGPFNVWALPSLMTVYGDGGRS